jgi:dihydroorotase
MAHEIHQNRFKVNPAIKYQQDADGLAVFLSRRQLAGIGTDHAPHPLDEKDRPYEKAPAGFPSIDLLLPLVVKAADIHNVAVEDMLHAVTMAPADEFGLANKGRITVGADADLLVCDPELEFEVDESMLPSKSRWSPYHGWQLRSRPQQVYLRGNLVFNGHEVVGQADGQPLFNENRIVS